MELNFSTSRLCLAHSWAISRTKASDTAEVVIIELDDRNGGKGLGEAAPVHRYDESTETVKDFLRSVDPKQLSFQDLPGSLAYLESVAPGNRSAKCAVDVALHDGASRKSRLPLHDFLGLQFVEQRYLTSFSIGIDSPEVIQRKVAAAETYPVLKLKVGVAADRAQLRALREVAPDKPVRLDANEGWLTKEEALRAIERLAEDGNIQFVEQPLPASTPVADYAWLKQRSPLPIFADESFHSAADVIKVAEGFHGVNVKLVKTGGITRAVRALQAARKAGLKTMIGCMIETSLLISAAAHLCELCDYIDLDGNLLITNDPYAGVTAERGMLSFAGTAEPHGLRVRLR